jgi:hypothetical protein
MSEYQNLKKLCKALIAQRFPPFKEIGKCSFLFEILQQKKRKNFLIRALKRRTKRTKAVVLQASSLQLDAETQPNSDESIDTSSNASSPIHRFTKIRVDK